jgi:hypothetical protein
MAIAFVLQPVLSQESIALGGLSLLTLAALVVSVISELVVISGGCVVIGEWLTRAIRSQIQTDRQSDLADLERMIALVERSAQANGKPVSTSIAWLTIGRGSESARFG